MMLTAMALLSLGASLGATFILICIWGFFGTSAPVAWWTWLSRTIAHDVKACGGLLVIQLAITLGASN
ncbi:MAG: hypothetical protein QM498_13595 [Desulfobacterium sp.]